MSDWVFPQDDDYKHIKSEFGYLEKQANIKLLKSQPQHYWKFVGLCQETNSAKKRGQTCSQNYEAECLDYDLKTKLGLLVGMSTFSKATHQVRIMTGEHHALKTCYISRTTTYRPPHSPSLKTFYFVSLSQMKLNIKGSCFDHIKNQIKRDMSLICQYYTTVLYSGRHTGSRVLPKRYIYKVRAKFQWARIFNYFFRRVAKLYNLTSFW